MGLPERDFVKIICAAGTEDTKIVHNIALVYTLAGADCIDMALNPEVVSSAQSGVEKALAIAKKWGLERSAPILCVSLGMEGDQHVRKARVTDIGRAMSEVDKKRLVASCPTRAIINDSQGVRVVENLCIGSGRCALIKSGAIEFYNIKRDLADILPKCKAAGASMFELHANEGPDDEVLAKWTLMNKVLADGYLSMCIGRSFKSNKEIVERIQKIQAISRERTLIQADGNPMTGDSDTINCTLQAVAMGDIVRKMKNPPLVILSGGTNSKTVELARHAGVLINGVSFGSYARKLVYNYIVMDGLESKEAELQNAVQTATAFVDKIRSELRGN